MKSSEQLLFMLEMQKGLIETESYNLLSIVNKKINKLFQKCIVLEKHDFDLRTVLTLHKKNLGLMNRRVDDNRKFIGRLKSTYLELPKYQLSIK